MPTPSTEGKAGHGRACPQCVLSSGRLGPRACFVLEVKRSSCFLKQQDPPHATPIKLAANQLFEAFKYFLARLESCF